MDSKWEFRKGAREVESKRQEERNRTEHSIGIGKTPLSIPTLCQSCLSHLGKEDEEGLLTPL